VSESKGTEVGEGEGKEKEKEEAASFLPLILRCGDWRAPQRSHTSDVRCIFEAMHYMLRCRGLSELQSKQVSERE
jgi:hypothetical protein